MGFAEGTGLLWLAGMANGVRFFAPPYWKIEQAAKRAGIRIMRADVLTARRDMAILSPNYWRLPIVLRYQRSGRTRLSYDRYYSVDQTSWIVDF